MLCFFICLTSYNQVLHFRFPREVVAISLRCLSHVYIKYFYQAGFFLTVLVFHVNTFCKLLATLLQAGQICGKYYCWYGHNGVCFTQ